MKKKNNKKSKTKINEINKLYTKRPKQTHTHTQKKRKGRPNRKNLQEYIYIYIYNIYIYNYNIRQKYHIQAKSGEKFSPCRE